MQQTSEVVSVHRFQNYVLYLFMEQVIDDIINIFFEKDISEKIFYTVRI